MMRSLRQLDRLDATHGLGTAIPANRRRRPVQDWLPFVVAPVAMILIAFMIPGVMPAEVGRLIGRGPERLAPVVSGSSTGAHAFLHLRPGSDQPITWDPCRPIRYAINPQGGPQDAVELVQESVEIVAALTGLEFEYTGLTDDRPEWERPFIPSFRSEKGPALISWATEEEVAALSGNVAGVGGAAAVPDRLGKMHLKGGGVTLDIASFDRMSERPSGGRAAQRRVILHELGHLVGLDHVDDDGELMAPGSPAREFGPGDREGLAILGRGDCA